MSLGDSGRQKSCPPFRYFESESHSVMSDSFRLLSPWNSPGQNTGVGKPIPSPADLPDPGIKPGPPTLQIDSLPTEISG